VHVADAEGVVVMDSRVLLQEVRTRGSGSDGATGALAGSSSTAKVNPRYGDAGASGAQKIIRAAADQLDYGSRLRGRTDRNRLLSRLGIELVAGPERATAETGYVPAWTQKRVAVSEGSLLMMASMSSPCLISVPMQFQAGDVTGHPLLDAGPGCVGHGP
jgi:hypothetical protein